MERERGGQRGRRVKEWPLCLYIKSSSYVTSTSKENTKQHKETNDSALCFLDGFGYDSQDNEEMMTNADIKKQGQQLMDFKRNKRRTKKRKS